MFVVGRAVTRAGSSGVLAGVFVASMAVASLRRPLILTGSLGGLEAITMVVSPMLGGSTRQGIS